MDTSTITSNTVNLTPKIDCVELKTEMITFEESKSKVKSIMIDSMHEALGKLKNKVNKSKKFFNFLKISLFSTVSVSAFTLIHFIYSIYSNNIEDSNIIIFFIFALFSLLIGFKIHDHLNDTHNYLYPQRGMKSLINDYNFFVHYINNGDINSKLDYFMPLSSKELNIISSNNEILKDYIAKNKDNFITMKRIDEALGKNNFEKKKFLFNFDVGINRDDNFLLATIKKLDTVNQNHIIDNFTKEKDNFKNCNESIELKQYQVNYSIDNGPIKSIIFSHSHNDVELFEKHINNMVEENYNRKCNIISINKIG